MAQYISKSQTVEARQYDSDLPLTVVHNDMGEQIAHKGDWLVGSERGLVYVLSDAKFQARFQPYSASPEDDQLKAAQLQIASQAGALQSANATVAQLQAQVAQLQGDNAALAKQTGDVAALSAQVADLTAKLAAAQAQAASDEQKLTDLAAAQKAAQDAQKIIDSAQEKLNQGLG